MSNPVEIFSAETACDLAADVVVVGASVAGFTVAVHCAELGANAVLLEKADAVGGTGRKAAAWMWVPNNHFMQQKGISDSKDDALRYLARMARPHGAASCSARAVSATTKSFAATTSAACCSGDARPGRTKATS